MYHNNVTMAHGEGSRAFHQFFQDTILRHFRGEYFQGVEDAAVLPVLPGRPVITTDSFVVTPLFFPGGDIGRLAVFGTVNDLAARGARPMWLTLSMIAEEGFDLELLDSILSSVAEAAKLCGVQVVGGDTKVVPRGAADKLYLTTTGLGYLREPSPPGAGHLRNGDILAVTGPIGRHGVAVLAAREDLGFVPPPESDCAPLHELTGSLAEQGIVPRAVRDATRGGVAAVLHEWAMACGRTLLIRDDALPLNAAVRSVCALLGLDPLHVANEGTMVMAFDPRDADRALRVLHMHPLARHAAAIGNVRARGAAPVVIQRILGRELPLDFPHGAPLPRIC